MYNQATASGRLIELQPLRYTPAGVPAVAFKLAHESTQQEAGGQRKVQCQIACICLGEMARQLARLTEGSEIAVKGFLAARSQRYPASLCLHVSDWRHQTSTATSTDI